MGTNPCAPMSTSYPFETLAVAFDPQRTLATYSDRAMAPVSPDHQRPDLAACSMTFATARGCEMKIAWLPLSSVTVECARR